MIGSLNEGDLSRIRTEIAELRAALGAQTSRSDATALQLRHDTDSAAEADADADATGVEPLETPAERLSREAHALMAHAEADLGALREQIERHPVVSVLAAFCVGLLVGRGTGR